MMVEVATVALQSADFDTALSSYIDETKPDPLARRQIESLIVQWEQRPQQQNLLVGGAEAENAATKFSSTESATRSSGSNTLGANIGGDAEVKEVKRVSGRLTLYGEYMSIVLDADCEWTWRPSSETTRRADASLSFRLTASASIIPLTQYKRLQKERQKRTSKTTADDEGKQHGGEEVKADRKAQRAQAKRRAGMIERLKIDPYVKILLEAAAEGETGSSKSKSEEKNNGNDTSATKKHILCEAEIQQSFAADGTVEDMQERVDISEDAVEGIRRAILSHLEENISVMELLLSLPFLPKDVETKKQGNGQEIKLELGHRAVLRLLEDAMFDACEKEGEDELLDELNISSKKGKDASSDEDSVGGGGRGPSPQRKKKSKR